MKKKQPVSKATFRYTVNLTPEENARFLTLYERSGMNAYARFIAARIFNEEFKVITIDKGAVDVYNLLLSFHAQFRSIGVNYNQVVKALKSNFTEKKAYAFLKKLHGETMKLAQIHEKVLAIATDFKEKYDS
jgi:hypothetical protein